MKKTYWNRLASGLMTFIMFCTLLPTSALALEPGEENQVPEGHVKVYVYSEFCDDGSRPVDTKYLDYVDSGMTQRDPSDEEVEYSYWYLEETETGEGFLFPKPRGVSMSDDALTDASAPVVYRYSDEAHTTPIGKFTCTKVFVYDAEGNENSIWSKESDTGSQSWPLSVTFDQANKSPIFDSNADDEYWVGLTWEYESLEQHKVTYDMNVANETDDSQENSLPVGVNVYPAVVKDTFDGTTSWKPQTPTYSYFTYYVGEGVDLNKDKSQSEIKFVEGQQFYPAIGNFLGATYTTVDLIGRSATPQESRTEWGTAIYDYYELIGWKIAGDTSGKVYKQGQDIVTMGDEDMKLVAQWKKIDFASIAADPKLDIEVPFADKTEIKGTKYDAVISQKNSDENAVWSNKEDSEEDALALNRDRQVFYRAELTMNPLIAGNNQTGNILANRAITDPAFAKFDIQVQLDEALELEGNDDAVTFQFTCGFLRPVAASTPDEKSEEPAADVEALAETGEPAAEESTITEIQDADGKRIVTVPYTTKQNGSGDSIDYTYTYAVPAASLKGHNTFVLPVEWRPTGSGYSQTSLTRPISLEVAATKISGNGTRVVNTTGKITGCIDMLHAGNGWDEQDITPLFLLTNLSGGWYDRYTTNGVNDIVDTLRATEQLRYAMRHVTLEANEVYAKVTVSGGGGGGSTKPPVLNTEDHYGYIIGYPEDYETGEKTNDQTRMPVKPEGSITRAEVATIFFRLLTDEARNEYWSQTSSYADVEADDWFNNAICTLSKAGILDGYEDGTFRPNGKITRAEFATIASRFFQYADKNIENPFSDVEEGAWYYQYIMAASDMGLINGYPDGTFQPNNPITRAESCAIVNRTLDRHPEQEHFLEDMLVWVDNMDTEKWYYEDMQEATNSHAYQMKTSSDGKYEIWTKMLPIRDWAAFEKEWSDANSAAGGEVVK